MRLLDLFIVFFLFLTGYCFIGYPLLIYVLAKLFPKPFLFDNLFRPKVSIILAAYNEELVLHRCIESLLRLDYPHEQMEILIGSDGSSDKTNEILSRYKENYDFIKPIYYTTRRGKMPVLNDLVALATGEILFFADADITLSTNTLREQLKHYTDESVGAVGGLYHVHSESEKVLYASEKEYASLEQRIRINEGVYHSSMGVFGGNYTIWRKFWKPLPDSFVHDDLYVALSIIDQKRRVVYEPTSIAIDLYNRSLKDEFRRKSRSASRGYHTLSFFPHLFGFSGGKNSFLLWSHKLLRWLSPFLLGIVFLLCVLGLIEYNELPYEALMAAFALVIVFTIIGFILEKKDIHIPIIRQCTWLVIMNLAYIAGTIKFILKTDEAVWSKATRHSDTSSPLKIKEAAHSK